MSETTTENQAAAQQGPEPLHPGRAQQISVALARHRELTGGKLIVNPRDEAEIRGLEKFFQEVMVQHGSEFMGCWIAIRQEYEPMVQVAARFLERITAINARRQ